MCRVRKALTVSRLDIPRNRPRDKVSRTNSGRGSTGSGWEAAGVGDSHPTASTGGGWSVILPQNLGTLSGEHPAFSPPQGPQGRKAAGGWGEAGIPPQFPQPHGPQDQEGTPGPSSVSPARHQPAPAPRAGEGEGHRNSALAHRDRAAWLSLLGLGPGTRGGDQRHQDRDRLTDSRTTGG